MRYIQDNPILSFAEHFEQVKTVYLRFKDDLKTEGMTLSDFSSLTPFSVSTLEPYLCIELITGSQQRDAEFREDLALLLGDFV